MPLQVIVTRPVATAAAWLDAMRARGIDARSLPLIEIRPEPLTGTLGDARANLTDWQAALFVSGNAVRCFFRSDQRPALPLAVGQTRAWAPGAGTRDALIQAGWPADQVDAPARAAHQFDSESLWREVAPQVQTGVRVLVVRGGDAQGRPAGRNWLIEKIAAAGGQADQIVAYRRVTPRLTAAQRALLDTARHDGSVWLFSSAHAITSLDALALDHDWSGARAVVTHERIGKAAQQLGFIVAAQVRPKLADVLTAIEALA